VAVFELWLRQFLQIIRTAPGSCCSHVTELLPTPRLCLWGRRASRPTIRVRAGFGGPVNLRICRSSGSKV